MFEHIFAKIKWGFSFLTHCNLFTSSLCH